MVPPGMICCLKLDILMFPAKKAGAGPADLFNALLLNHLDESGVVPFTEDKFLENAVNSQVYSINKTSKF